MISLTITGFQPTDHDRLSNGRSVAMSFRRSTKMGVDNQTQDNRKSIVSPRLQISDCSTISSNTKQSPRPAPRVAKSTLSTEAKSVLRKSNSSSVKKEKPLKPDGDHDSASDSVALPESSDAVSTPHRSSCNRNFVASSDDIRVGDSSGNKIRQIIRQFNSFNSYKHVSEVAKARFSRLSQIKSASSSEITAQNLSQPVAVEKHLPEDNADTINATSPEECISSDLKSTNMKSRPDQSHKRNKKEYERTDSDNSIESPTDGSKTRPFQTRPTSVSFNRSGYEKRNICRSSPSKDAKTTKPKSPDQADSSQTRVNTLSKMSQLSVPKGRGSRSSTPTGKLKQPETVGSINPTSSPSRSSQVKARDVQDKSEGSLPHPQHYPGSGKSTSNKTYSKISVKMGTKSPISQKRFHSEKEAKCDLRDVKLSPLSDSDKNNSVLSAAKSSFPHSANKTNKTLGLYSPRTPGQRLQGSKQSISHNEGAFQPDMSVTSAEPRPGNLTVKKLGISMTKVSVSDDRKVDNKKQQDILMDMSVTSGVIQNPIQDQSKLYENESQIDMSVTSAMSLPVNGNKKYLKKFALKKHLVKPSQSRSLNNNNDKTKQSENIETDMSVTSAGLLPLNLNEKQQDSGIVPDMTVTSALHSPYDADIHISNPKIDSSEPILSVRQRALIFSGGDEAKQNTRKRDNVGRGKLLPKKLASYFSASEDPDQKAPTLKNGVDTTIQSISESVHVSMTQQSNDTDKHEKFPDKKQICHEHFSAPDACSVSEYFSSTPHCVGINDYTIHVLPHEKKEFQREKAMDMQLTPETKMFIKSNETIPTIEILEKSLSYSDDSPNCEVQTPTKFSVNADDLSSAPLAESTPCEDRPTSKFHFSQSEANVYTVSVDSEANRASPREVDIREVNREYQKATDRINLALVTLKSELKAMREQDLVLLRQLINISETIQRLSGTRKLRLSKSLSMSLTGSFQQKLQQQPRSRGLSSSTLERQSSVPQVEDMRRMFFSSSRHTGSFEDSMSSIDESEFGSMASELDSTLFSSASTLSLYHQFSPVSPEPRPKWGPFDVSASHESLGEPSYEEILRRNVRLWKMSAKSHRPAVVEEVTCLL